MSHVYDAGTKNIMQSTETQNSFACHAPKFSTSSNCSANSSNSVDSNSSSNIMRPSINFSIPSNSGSNASVSTRSSFSYESTISTSSSATSMPKRSSMKSSLKMPNPHRKSAPPTVRFAFTEPPGQTSAQPTSTTRYRYLPNTTSNRVPNPLLQHQHRASRSFASPASGVPGYKDSSQNSIVSPRPSGPLTVPKRISRQAMEKRVSSAPLSPPPSHLVDPTWSPVPLAFTPGSRVASYQSTASNFSVQSAPAVLSTPPEAVQTSGQYNPLHHYIPCLDSSCSTYYTHVHAGPTYYLPQGPYSIPRLHGYCHRHATNDFKEANAFCKKEWERRRQQAGRKTLVTIDVEFDVFLEQYRMDRQQEDTALQRTQKRRILGAKATPSDATKPSKGVAQEDRVWDWRYTPRQCTTSGCKKAPYSPFANHLFPFYSTPRPSTFKPLQTLCPACAKSEIETFEQNITQKWASRCGWNETEWNDWFMNVARDREMEVEFWEKAQERVVREKGPARWIDRLEEVEPKVQTPVGNKGKQSIFRKLFSSMMTS
jgi:hypothetical protein